MYSVAGSANKFNEFCGDAFKMGVRKILSTPSSIIDVGKDTSDTMTAMKSVMLVVLSRLCWTLMLKMYTSICDSNGMPDLESVVSVNELQFTVAYCSCGSEDVLKTFDSKTCDLISKNKAIIDVVKDTVSNAHKSINDARAKIKKAERQRLAVCGICNSIR
jgi:hypothetical protein